MRAAYELLASSGLRELPIIDGERRVVGLINDAAIAHAYLGARRAGARRPAAAPAPRQ